MTINNNELSEFIAESLLGIKEGIDKANKKQSMYSVNLFDQNSGSYKKEKYTVFDLAPESSQTISSIKFDVSVTISEDVSKTKEASSGAGLMMKIVRLDADKKSETNNSESNLSSQRISFSVAAKEISAEDYNLKYGEK